MDFSLFFFSAEDTDSDRDKYRLLIDCAQFADRNGFQAVWVPERHFSNFGGLYPNPALTCAALATLTDNVRLRAGSCILPLHDPLRVAEEWAVVDSLSGGRVGISVGSGWHVNDFVLAPEIYDRRKEVMMERLETIRALWRGEPVVRRNGAGIEVETRVYPKPFRADIPIWFTAESPGTFEAAGKMGFNVLTRCGPGELHKLELGIELYRKGREEGGHDPGHFTLMQHLHIADQVDQVLAEARPAYHRYIRTNMALRVQQEKGLGKQVAWDEIPRAQLEELAEEAFQRHWDSTSMIGTTQMCTATARRFRELGVDEIACLVDFVFSLEQVRPSLELLNQIRQELESEVA